MVPLLVPLRILFLNLLDKNIMYINTNVLFFIIIFVWLSTEYLFNIFVSIDECIRCNVIIMY